MNEANPTSHFSDANLRAAMHRAFKMTAALAVFAFGVLSLLLGWKTGALFLSGVLVSATGLYEWQQLVGHMNAKLDQQKTPHSTGFVLGMFLLRLGLAAGVIYVSLKCFRGPVYALVGGLGLAALALLIEVARQSRS
jgi:membrane protein implicated in regulation of membrane protease activity